MAYIGQSPFQEFSSIPTKDSFTGDGSTTTFDLANDVVRGAENALEVFIDNVRQEPGSGKAFTLGVDGSNNFRRITFASAPANGASIYVINDKTNLTAIAPINTDFNGAELVLDADADTTLHADTDDEIDVQVSDEHVNSVQVSDNISMILRWPTIKDVSNIGTDDIVDSTMKLLQTCITEVIDGDTVHRRSDFNSEELNEFIDSLPFECFEQIGNFSQTMPKLLHMVKVKNPKTNVESEVKLEGIDNFF